MGGYSVNSIEIVERAINELIIEFKDRRDYFFNEHDIHHVFYCKLSDLGDLIHPEYPTKKRFIRIRNKDMGHSYIEGEHCFEPDVKKGVRGHYDFVVLNQDFYNKYQSNFPRISNKRLNTNLDIDYKYIDVAIEFKYITDTFNLLEIEYDLFKLKQADEVKHKKLIIFTRRRKTDKNFEDSIKLLENLKKDENEVNIKII
jgi:hypothetical protein